MTQRVVMGRRANIRILCAVLSISETCYRYPARLPSENKQIADGLLRLNITHKRWDFGLCL